MTISREDLAATTALAGRVRRYHTWPVVHAQSVAEHAWRVATIYVEVFGLPNAEVLWWVLHHDSGELTAGDTPYGAKRDHPALAEAVNAAEREGLRCLGLTLPTLTPQEFQRAKLADLLEMWEYGLLEVNMGNQYGWTIADDKLRGQVHHLAKSGGHWEQVRGWLSEKGWPTTDRGGISPETLAAYERQLDT